jgi:hypothetical protein
LEKDDFNVPTVPDEVKARFEEGRAKLIEELQESQSMLHTSAVKRKIMR